MVIVALLLHIRIPMMQYNIISHSEALHLAMRLKASLVGETGAGMVHIQSQLAIMSLQIQDIKKGKESREEVWCTRYKTEGCHKD